MQGYSIANAALSQLSYIPNTVIIDILGIRSKSNLGNFRQEWAYKSHQKSNERTRRKHRLNRLPSKDGGDHLWSYLFDVPYCVRERVSMKTLFLILLLTTSIFPCGAPQDISGRVVPMSPRSTVTITDGFQIFSTPTNPFGYFRFSQMLPCTEYQIDVRNKFFFYPSVVIVLPGDHGIDVILEPK